MMGSDTPAGRVIISNSHFGGGCSDGVQLNAGETQIGPGNEFTGILQGPCGSGVHADPVQCVGSSGTTLIGN